jgi:glucose-1-phosphatase
MDAILFDLGNVFVFHDNERLFALLARLFGVDLASFRRHVDATLWDRVHRGHLPGEQLLSELNRRFNASVTLSAFEVAWCGHFRFNDDMPMLLRLLPQHLPFGILSNSHDLHINWLLPQMPFLRRAKALVFSHEEGLVKPEAQLYHRALQRLGTRPEATLFFDDMADYVEGARKVGMPAFQFTTALQCRADLAASGIELSPPAQLM